MIECRPIVRAEAPAYLRLLCRVFELDYIRAEQIFFHEPFFDLNRKWALFDDGIIRCVLTTVPLHFGIGDAIGIAGVATAHDHRRRGLGQRLVEAALVGEERVLLFAKAEGLYRRSGLSVIDHVIRARFEDVPIDADAEVLTFEEIQQVYNAWEVGSPFRLQRDATRWEFWKWNLRMCSQVPGGYFCQEGDTVRECVYDAPPARWPVFENAEWLGLRSMATRLELPLRGEQEELILMGKGFPEPPQMFMTDQF